MFHSAQAGTVLRSDAVTLPAVDRRDAAALPTQGRQQRKAQHVSNACLHEHKGAEHQQTRAACR